MPTIILYDRWYETLPVQIGCSAASSANHSGNGSHSSFAIVGIKSKIW